jgi:hypothetical protein
MKPIRGWKRNLFWKIFLNPEIIALSKVIPRELCTTTLIVIPAKAGIQETIDNTGFRFSPE